MLDQILGSIPHSTLRKGQWEACSAAFEKAKIGGALIIEAGTGFGKSIVPVSLSSQYKVLVAVQSIGLLEQYERVYGFNILKGRDEYPCILKNKLDLWSSLYQSAPTVAHCHFKKSRECPVYDKCLYHKAKREALASNKMACTYKYASLSTDIHNRDGIIVFDEAHASSDEVLDVAEFVVTQETIKRYSLLPMPIVSYGIDGGGDIVDKKHLDVLRVWFMINIEALSNKYDPYQPMSQSSSNIKSLVFKMRHGLELVESGSSVFLYAGSINRHGRGGLLYNKTTQIMMLRPIESKTIINKMICNKHTSILMSATIGNPDRLVEELGIGEYNFIDIGHPVPRDYRPVYDLGIDKMTMKNIRSTPGLQEYQAGKIAEFISSLDSKWRGIILTTSNDRVRYLREYLSNKLNGRVIIPKEGEKVTERINRFITDIDNNNIAVDTIQGWGHGLDLYGDKARFCVVAGVPFANPTDRYDMARASRDGGQAYSYWQAFISVVQACGRVTRGEKDNSGNWEMNVSALADGSAISPYARHNYPKYFREAIIKW